MLEKFKSMFDVKNPKWWRRFLIMVAGNLFMGLGVYLLKGLVKLGNDPHGAMCIALGERFNCGFSVAMWIISFLCFLVEFIWGRDLLGPASLVNWLLVGPFYEMWRLILDGLLSQISFPFWARLGLLVPTVLLLSLCLAVYQDSNLGVSPFDSLAIVFARHTPVPYFWWRIAVDTSAVVVALLAGGTVGIGTVACMFGLGPFVSFFSSHLCAKLFGETVSTKKKAS